MAKGYQWPRGDLPSFGRQGGGSFRNEIQNGIANTPHLDFGPRVGRVFSKLPQEHYGAGFLRDLLCYGQLE
jgi:hypothetical protein